MIPANRQPTAENGQAVYAVNMADLLELPPIIARLLLHDFVSLNSPRVEVERGRIDGFAVVLDGPAARNEARVRALVELLTGPVSRRVGRPMRVYRRGPRGGWKKVTVRAGDRKGGATTESRFESSRVGLSLLYRRKKHRRVCVEGG